MKYLLIFLIPVIYADSHGSGCLQYADQRDYRGTISTTKSGKTCQKWTEQDPHKHSRTSENYPDAGLGDHNYCRNPDQEAGAWCYTTDPSSRWELCDVPQCIPGCFQAPDQSDYRGEISKTESGKTCQKWTVQDPHEHSRTPENYPDAGLGDHNYCRNPDQEAGAWCYTTDPSSRWELCDVPQCIPGCFQAPDQSDYRGEISKTESGKTCQKWTVQDPHEHSRTPENYPDAGLGDHNYCRNPDQAAGAWCYTTERNTRWELCSIPKCVPVNPELTITVTPEKVVVECEAKKKGCTLIFNVVASKGSEDVPVSSKNVKICKLSDSGKPSQCKKAGCGAPNFCKSFKPKKKAAGKYVAVVKMGEKEVTSNPVTLSLV